jgi:hypothetical protein
MTASKIALIMLPLLVSTGASTLSTIAASADGTSKVIATTGWLGVDADSPDLKTVAGARVAPRPDSPAAKAGIKSGDIVTSVNGKEIKTVNDFVQKISELAPGTSVSLLILRDGALQTMPVTLGTRPTIAASPAEEFRNRVIAQGGCANIHIFSDAIPKFPKMPERLNEAILYGKPLVDWSDGDVAATIRLYKDCVALLHASQVNSCVARGNAGRRDYCEKTVSESDRSLLSLQHSFENNVGSAVMGARKLDNLRKAQQTAQIELAKAESQRKRDQAEKDAQQQQEQLREQAQRDREAAEEARQQQQARVEFEKAQAERRLAQAEEDAHRKQEQLREQAQRDREAADATARLAEREEPKIAEATREAEAARHARHAAEQRLAEIRSRMEAQEMARKQQADQDAAEQKQKVAQEAAAQANLPINILGTAYASYVDVKRCQEARDGYAAIYISNPEMDHAKDAVRTIEQTMKSKLDQNTTTDDVWSRVATTEGRNFHPSRDYQEGTRSLCRSRLEALLRILRDQAPETGMIKKDF